MMKNSKLNFSVYMQNSCRSKSFGKFVLIVCKEYQPNVSCWSQKLFDRPKVKFRVLGSRVPSSGEILT